MSLAVILLIFLSQNCVEGLTNEVHRAEDCPCSDVKYCQRIAVPDRQEVVGYAVNLTHYRQYDWNKLTTVVVYERMLPKFGMELVCLAHKYQTRVLIATSITADQLKNATARNEVVKYYFNLAEKYFMDGANVDVELETSGLSLRNGLTAYIKEMKSTFAALYPSSLVIADVFWLPNLFHDTLGMANASDFLFIMSYDEQADMLSPCVARANAPYAQTEFGVVAFRAMGVPGRKLVVGLPWYGYLYNCTELSDNLCHIKKLEGHCTQRVGVEIDYSAILNLLPRSISGRQWSSVYKSPFLNYKDATTGVVRQVWFDDTESLKLKYDLADTHDLRGVGIWHVDALDYTNTSDPTTRDMWNALPAYK